MTITPTSQGKQYTKAEAQELLDGKMLEVWDTADTPEAKALMVKRMTTGGYDTTVIQEQINRQATVLLNTHNALRGPSNPGYTTTGPQDYNVVSALHSLPSDPGENTGDLFEADGDLLEAFEIFEGLVDIVGGIPEAQKHLGLDSGVVGQVFANATKENKGRVQSNGMRAGGIPAERRLRSAFRNLQIDGFAPDPIGPMDNKTEAVFQGLVQGTSSALTTRQWERVKPIIQHQMDTMPFGSSKTDINERTKEWAKTNLYVGDDHTRIGPRLSILQKGSHFYKSALLQFESTEHGVAEEAFFHRLKEQIKSESRLSGMLPGEDIEFIVLNDVDNNQQVFTYIIDKDGNPRDMFDATIKTQYSTDDLVHILAGMVARDKALEFKSGRAPDVRTGRHRPINAHPFGG